MSVGGKCAVVTGSNSGIGLGVAEELARLGANVALNSFSDRCWAMVLRSAKPLPRLLNMASHAQLICITSGSDRPAICVVRRSR